MIGQPKKKKGKGKGGIAKDQHKSVKLESSTPFSIGKKRPEPDDRPRPMRPASANPGTKSKAARFKKLQGIAI